MERPIPTGRSISWLNRRQITEAALHKPLALVPVGSIEQHGPHLPVGTDVILAERIAREVASRADNVWVAEPIAYGCSWHHLPFAGVISLRPSTLISLVVDVLRSVADNGFTPVVFNGHGGNRAALAVALLDLAAVGVTAYSLSYFELVADQLPALVPDAKTSIGHACAMETSLLMYLWPESVEVAAIPKGTTPPAWPDPHLLGKQDVVVWRRFGDINPTGVIGRPELASAELGGRIYWAAVERCADAIQRIAVAAAESQRATD